MRLKFPLSALLLALSLFSSLSASISARPEPVAIYRTPQSIIARLWRRHVLYVGTRWRFSTCTGVGWFSHSHKLIAANLLDNSFRLYDFQPEIGKISSPLYVNDAKLSRLSWPENLCFSRDGSVVAISNSDSGCVNFYEVDSEAHQLRLPPTSYKYARDHGLHGLRFSSSDEFLAYVTYDGPGSLRFFRYGINAEGARSLELTQALQNSLEGIAPKGIDFSPDDRYVAICYGAKATRTPVKAITGVLAIYRFDARSGQIDQDPISQIGVEEGLSIPEDLCFCQDGTSILVSNQGNDTITIYDFDREMGTLGEGRVLLQNPQAQLSFPHGLSISPDGHYLAVSNYGDDKITIYELFSTDP